MVKIFQLIFKMYMKDARWITLLVVIVTIVGALASVSAPYIFSRFVDGVASGGVWKEYEVNLYLYALVFGVAIAIGQSARFLIFLCAERLSLIASSLFFSRILRKTSAFFVLNNGLEIGNARREGANTLNTVVQLFIGGLLPGIVQIALSVAVLGGLLSWDIAAIVFIYGSLVVLLDYLRVAYVKPSLDSAIRLGQENAALMGNALNLIDAIRQTQSESWIQKLFFSSAGNAFASWRKYALLSSSFSFGLGVLAFFQLAITFFVLGPKYETGMISIGDIVLFNMLLFQLNEPFHFLGLAIKEMVEAVARFKPLTQMWEAEEHLDPLDAITFTPSAGCVGFQNVSFHYPNGLGVSEVTFRARRGIPTFLVGETGSGKSTILKLLLKGLLPDSGRIVVDGVDLSLVKNADWFSHIGVVPQDIVLLNDTISTNIVLGRTFDRRLLYEAARRASILDRVLATPGGFDTVVGERGLMLSGGERQRIAIARALYSNPGILILDEASSSLDDETERQIMDGLRHTGDSLTIIAVTHRKSTIKEGDFVVNLKPDPVEAERT